MSEILAKPTSLPLSIPDAKDATATSAEKVILKDIKYFSRSSNMRKLKNDLEVNKKIKKFNDKVIGILDTIDTFQCDNKIEMVFLFVLQSAEDYFDPCHVEVKRDVCKKLLVKYTGGDEEACLGFMRLAEKNIKKTSPIRRFKKKTGKFMNWFFQMS
jgi:hypothetical protein